MKRRLLQYLALFAALAVAALVAASLWSRRVPETGLVGGKLRPCPDKPNCVCSEVADGGAAIAPLRYSGAPHAAMELLAGLLSEQPRARILDSSAGYLHAEFRTALLRFVDDVEFRLDEDAGVIHVRSASRVGHSDLGQNRRRVEELRQAFAKRQQARPAAE